MLCPDEELESHCMLASSVGPTKRSTACEQAVAPNRYLSIDGALVHVPARQLLFRAIGLPGDGSDKTRDL